MTEAPEKASKNARATGARERIGLSPLPVHPDGYGLSNSICALVTVGQSKGGHCFSWATHTGLNPVSSRTTRSPGLAAGSQAVRSVSRGSPPGDKRLEERHSAKKNQDQRVADSL